MYNIYNITIFVNYRLVMDMFRARMSNYQLILEAKAALTTFKGDVLENRPQGSHEMLHLEMLTVAMVSGSK